MVSKELLRIPKDSLNNIGILKQILRVELLRINMGYYKVSFGSQYCLPCLNKPENAKYTKVGETSSTCSYECNDP